jgi:hypothetical protein
VVGRQHQHERARILPGQQQGGAGDRRSGIAAAADGLEHDGRRLASGIAELLGDDETVLLVADDERGGEAAGIAHAGDGLLQQAALGGEREKLLRIEGPRKRP